jgi:predicted metalloprotease with PDZ domain
VTATNIDGLLARYAAGDSIEVLAFRRDELMRFDVHLATQPPLKILLETKAKAGRSAEALRKRWLHG